MTKSKDSTLHCSFCGKNALAVAKLIAGPDIYICDECIDTCYDIVHASSSSIEEDNEPKTLISPHDIKAHLDDFVIGQDTAKIAVSVAVHNHYKRINDNSDDDIDLEKSNILLIGPSGVGKTMLVQTVAKILEVPFAMADATSLTETGYVGEDVESIISRLLASANYDIGAAQRGIVFIDEIDKLRRKTEGSAAKDVGSEGVQQALLKLLEGSEVMVPSGGRRGPNVEMVKIDTSDILFICGGAFTGIEEIVGKGDGAGIGFGSNIIDRATMSYGEIEPTHLAKYGMIPEFIGRLPVITTLSDLDEDQLVRILTEPKNAIVRQFVKLFALDGVKLTFAPEALVEVARTARKHKTGARGLRSVIEKALLTVQFNLPTLARGGLKEVIINADVITHRAEPNFKNRRKKKAVV